MTFNALAGIKKGLKGALPKLAPVDQLKGTSVSERKDVVVGLIEAVAGKNGNVEVLKKAVFNSHDFTTYRQDLVQKTIGFISILF